ncbi:MAG: glycosyltransferase [Chloroflexi bacterium]|nr:glycosyltransferase [Chloroflexota bacterium]
MSAPPAASPLISVVIPTRDRAHELAITLPGLLASHYPAFEVVLADQSTTDATLRLVATLGDTRLHLLHLPESGRSRAMNAGIEAAQGEIVAILDDDCTVSADWLQRVARAVAAAPDNALIFGAIAPVPHDPRQEMVPHFLPPTRREFHGVPLTPFRLVPSTRYAGGGAHVFARRTVFVRLGGFDEWLGVGAPLISHDETDLAYRALRMGYTVLLDPDTTVLHRGRYTGKPAIRRLYAMYGFGHGAMYMRHALRGDWRAVYLLAQEGIWRAGQIALALLQRRRPPAVRYLAYMGLGALAAVRWPRTFHRPLANGMSISLQTSGRSELQHAR